MALNLVTAPTVEPITVAEAKENMGVDYSTHDTMIGNLITAARQHAENFTSRAFVQQTWDLFLDGWSSVIEIPKSPIQSVTTVKYIDTDGVQQTLNSSVYTVDTSSEPGRIYLAYNQSWPTYRPIRHAIEIRYIAGYADSGASPQDLADNVPQAIKAAIKLHVGHLYEHRESASDFKVEMVPMGWMDLIHPYRLLRL